VDASDRSTASESARTRRLGVRGVAGLQARVATSRRARLLGLAGIEREAAPPALLIPGCRSIHTFGMRFALDIVFFDGEMHVVSRRWRLAPRRLAFENGARSVLEIPSLVAGAR